MSSMKNIWILVQHTGDAVDEVTFGLIKEAECIISQSEEKGTVTAVLMGTPEDAVMDVLKESGLDRVLHLKHEALNRYNGEIFCTVFYDAVKGENVSCILLAQNESASDFSARLAAVMNTALISRAVDFKIDNNDKWLARRPVSNGYLFEELVIETDNPPVVSYHPSVLSAAGDAAVKRTPKIEEINPEIVVENLRTKVINVIAAEPGDLDIEDADIIVSGGRGAGKGDDFNLVHELAEAIKGSVAGTRPVIDTQTLPFERQIGQTGKSVSPDLIINCGISGANEYSAGMEKSKNVISINKDPRARIFRFSDLAVVGDLQEIIPILIEKIKKNDLTTENTESTEKNKR